MPKVTEDTIIIDVLKMDSGTAPIFMRAGMHCLGCPASSNESIAEACMAHGIDAQELIDELNDYLGE